MADVFISYSRKDSDFVRQLHEALKQHGRDTWVDWEDIPPTAEWWKEVTTGIEAADTFVFVISPDSLASEICRREIDHAVQNQKRIVPILRRQPEGNSSMHPSVGSHNWLFFRPSDEFDKALLSLLNALETDLSHVRAHTRLLIRAREWESNQREGSFLLRGGDLANAEAWLTEAARKRPAAAPIQVEYITASRAADTRRGRLLLAGVSMALVVALGLALLAFLLNNESNRQRTIAEANAATAVVAQDIAYQQAATAVAAQGEAEIQRGAALANAATAVAAQDIAYQQAATAVAAQEEALEQRNAAQAAATQVADERRQAQSIALAGQAEVEINGPRPDRAALLVLRAFERFAYTWQAERALARAVVNQLARRELSGHSGEVTGVDWSADNAQVLTAGNDATVRIWDATSGQQIRSLGMSSPVARALWSPDGRWIAAGDANGDLEVWSAEGLAGASFAGHSAAIYNLEWSPDSRRLASVSVDGSVRLWERESGALLFTLQGHSAPVNSVQWSPDGTQIVTASEDMTARIWDAATGAPLTTLRGHSGQVRRALWSPDGSRIVTASDDTTAIIWDALTGEVLFTLSGHTRPVIRVGWSPDGGRIATASADSTAKVWDATTGTLLRTLFGHTAAVRDLGWSPGGTRLITVSEDRTVRIWNAESGGELLMLEGHRGLIWDLDWASNGRFVATASADGSARIWQIWNNQQALIRFARECCAERPLTDEESIQFGLPVPTSLPPYTDPESCPGTLPSLLYVGVRGQVADDDARALNVRSQPNRNAALVGQIPPGQTFQVLAGPTCADGIAWFQVIYGINAVQGWIAEGLDERYFVQPIS